MFKRHRDEINRRLSNEKVASFEAWKRDAKEAVGLPVIKDSLGIMERAFKEAEEAYSTQRALKDAMNLVNELYLDKYFEVRITKDEREYVIARVKGLGENKDAAYQRTIDYASKEIADVLDWGRDEKELVHSLPKPKKSSDDPKIRERDRFDEIESEKERLERMEREKAEKEKKEKTEERVRDVRAVFGELTDIEDDDAFERPKKHKEKDKDDGYDR